MTGLYRKKPIPVEARQLLGSKDGQTGRDLADWCGGSVGGLFAEPKVLVPTLEGDLMARAGDWIVKGPRGEFWPVKGSVFAETYDECPPAGEFFEPGHTYTHGDYRFSCEHLATHPTSGHRSAWGWFGKNDAWRHHSFSERQFQAREWTDITDTTPGDNT
jgi:hypothetical protein